MAESTEKNLDLIWGANAIGRVIGRSKRATFDMLDKGEIPAKKVNGRWVIERGRLVAFFMDTVSDAGVYADNPHTTDRKVGVS